MLFSHFFPHFHRSHQKISLKYHSETMLSWIVFRDLSLKQMLITGHKSMSLQTVCKPKTSPEILLSLWAKHTVIQTNSSTDNCLMDVGQ